MTRQSFQKGYVSKPIRTKQGEVYKIRYRVRSADGKSKHRCETLYNMPGRKAARAVVEQRIREASAMPPETSDLTFKEFVDTFWLAHQQRKGMKPSTQVGYDCALKKHILPALGGLKLADIAPLDIENLMKNLMKSKLDEKSTLCAKTALNLLRLVQGIFSVAVDFDLIARSPVRKQHMPSVLRSPKVSMDAPTGEVDPGRNSAQGHRPLFTCLALTGLRAGELLALQWKHIDLERGELRVEQSLWNGQVVTPKTRTSSGSIWFDAVLTQVFREHRASSRHTGPEDFVFCKSSGLPLNPDVLRRDILYPALDRLRIPRMKGASGLHAFRHTAGSVVEREDRPAEVSAKPLETQQRQHDSGHLHAYVTKEAERGAAIALERAYLGDLFPIVSQFGEREQETRRRQTKMQIYTWL